MVDGQNRENYGHDATVSDDNADNVVIYKRSLYNGRADERKTLSFPRWKPCPAFYIVNSQIIRF
jgi:hypothetical protein